MNFRRAISLMPALIILSLAWTYQQYIPYLIASLLVGISLILSIKGAGMLSRLTQKVKFRDVDNMDGLEFELYIAQVLKANRYTRVRLTKQYDYGVDILARKDGVRWGIQVKRNRSQTKAEAVRQVVTGLKVYNCDRAMVITNSYFGRYAKVLARANNCVLIDRAGLSKLIP